MIRWQDISLYRFQYIDQTNAMTTIDDVEKVLLITCELFGLTSEELDMMPVKKVNRRIRAVMKLMNSSPVGVARKKIGPYTIEYDPSRLTLGQFVELRYFLQDHIHMGHYILASLSRRGKKYESEGHSIRADFFLRQSITHVIAVIKDFAENFAAFLKEYNALFGLDKEMYDQGEQSDRFNKQYGWQYSAELIADYERISLDRAYGLPIRQALNDLAYLKAKGKYEAEQQQKMLKGINSK